MNAQVGQKLHSTCGWASMVPENERIAELACRFVNNVVNSNYNHASLLMLCACLLAGFIRFLVLRDA
jgi:hypothetical protein